MKHCYFPMFAVLAAGLLSGCFDVGQTNLRVIDNFNSGDLQPTDPGFGPWSCELVSPYGDSSVDCAPDAASEDGSPFSLLMRFTIMDPPDGLQQHGGADAATKATAAPVDFTRYGRIAFDLKLESSGANPLPAGAVLYVELGCMTVLPLGVERHDLYVTQGVPYSSIWHNVALTLVNFGPPAALVEPITGGPTECLRHVDVVRFRIDAELPDGKTGEATLHLDNFVLE